MKGSLLKQTTEEVQDFSWLDNIPLNEEVANTEIEDIPEVAEPNILDRRLTIKAPEAIGLDQDGRQNVDELYFNKIVKKRDNGDGVITLEELPSDIAKTDWENYTGEGGLFIELAKKAGGVLRFSHDDKDNAFIIEKIKTGKYGYDIKSRQLIKLDEEVKGFTDKSADELAEILTDQARGVTTKQDKEGKTKLVKGKGFELYTSEEDDGLSKVKSILGEIPGLKIEATDVGWDRIKIKSKKSGEEIVLEFDLDGLHGESKYWLDYRDEEGANKLAEENNKKLHNFLKKEIEAGNIDSWDVWRQVEHLGLEASAYYESLQESEMAPVREEGKKLYLNNEDLFKPVTTTSPRTVTFASKHSPTATIHEGTTTTTYPHSDLINSTSEKLKNENLDENQLRSVFVNYGGKLDEEEEITIEKVAQQIVRQRLYTDHINEHQAKWVDTHIAEMGDRGKELGRFYLGQVSSQLREFKEYDKNMTKQDVNIGYIEQDKEILRIIEEQIQNPLGAENIRFTEEQIEKFTQFATEKGLFLPDFGEGQDVVLENGKIINSNVAGIYALAYQDMLTRFKLQEEYSEKANNAAAEIIDDEIAGQAFALNYQLGEKYMGNIGLGFGDIAFGIAQTGYKITEYLTPFGWAGMAVDHLAFEGKLGEGVQSFFTGYNELSQRERAQYTRDVEFTGDYGAFTSPSRFGRFMLQETSTQLPIFAAIMMSGGYGALTIGASSAGGKYSDMQSEMVQGTADYSELNMLLTSLGYGGIEGVISHYTTVPILKRAQQRWVANGQDKLLEGGQNAFINSQLPSLRSEILLETLGETTTMGLQNGVEIMSGKNIGLLDNIGHAGFSGASMTLLFAGVPFLKGMYQSRMSDRNSLKKTRELFNKKLELSRKINDGRSSDRTRAIYIKELEQVNQEYNAEMERQTDLINNHMGAGAASNIVSITEAQMELQNTANEILNIPDSEMSKEDKARAINLLRDQFNQLDAIKTNALSDKAKQQFRTEFIALAGKDPKLYNQYIDKAKQKLIADGKDPKGSALEREASDLYWTDKIKENNAKLKKGVKNRYNFQSFDTVADAENYINDELDLTAVAKATLEEQGTLMEDGKYKMPDGKTMTIEDAVKNLKDNLIKGLKVGKNDGVAIKNVVTIAVVENQVINERSEIKTHEIGHQAFWDIFSGTDHDVAFADISKQILTTLKSVDKKLYKEFLKDGRIYNSDGSLDSKEVISVFLEYVGRSDVDFVTEKKNKGLSLLFGTMVQKHFDADYNFDFRGENDMYNFVVGLGKKIKAGDLTLKDIKEAKQSAAVTTLISDIDTDAPAGVYDLAASKGTNLEGLLNKFIKENRSSGSRYSRISEEEKRDKLNSFLNEKLSRDSDGNLVEDMMESELMQEMMPYIKSQANYIWSGVDPMNRNNVTKDEWERDVATELYTMIQQEYLKPGKDGIVKTQDLDKFVRNRGYFRVFTLAKQTFNQLPARLDPNAPQVKNITDTDPTDDDKKRGEDNKKRKKKKDLLNTLKFKDSDGKLVPLPTEITTEIENNILKTFKTKLGKFKNPIGTPEFRTELSKEYQQKVSLLFRNVMQRGDKFNTDPKKDKISNKQKRINVENFVDSTFDAMWDRMDIGTANAKYPFLTERATNTDGSPAFMSVAEARAHNDAIDKGLSQGKKIKNIYSRNRKWKKIDKEDARKKFKEYMKAEGEASNVYGARVLSYADWLASTASFELQTDVLRKEGYEGEAFVNDLDMQFGTRNIAWSKGVNNLTDAKKEIFYDRLTQFTTVLDVGKVDIPKGLDKEGEKEVRNEMKEYFKSKLTKVYGDALTKKEINAIANDLYNYAKLFNLAKPVVKKLPIINKKVLGKFLKDQFVNAETSETVRRLLDLDKPITEGFDDIDRIKKQRGLVGRFVRRFRTEKGKKQAIIDLFSIGKGMFSTSGRIGNRTFKIEKGQIVRRTDAEMKKLYPDAPKGKLPKQGYQVFENNKDFFDTIVNEYEGEIEYKLDGKGQLIELKIDGKVIDPSEYTLLPEATNSVIDKNGELSDDFDFDERKAQAKRVQGFVKNMMKIIKNDRSFDNMDMGMTIMSMQQTMQSPIKRAANLEYASIQKGLKASDYRWEHIMPTNYVIVNLIDYYVNNKNADADALADKLFSKYQTSLIPKTMDKVLDEVRLTQFMPADYTLEQPVWKRYYNFLTFGDPRIKAIVSLNPKGEKIEIGKTYEEAGKVINKRKLSETIKYLESTDIAFSKGRTWDFSKKRKGISVLDFDDTVAISKSKVGVTMPDGTKFKINATEFAKKHNELMSKGAEFDYTEFNKVVDGKPGPLFNKLKKAVDKFGNENVFILTARDPEAAVAIHAFLKGMGIDLKLENITGLANGDPQAKADWIVGKVAEGYNDFYFADDAIANVKAVKDVLDNFDVKSKVQQARIAWSKGLNAEMNQMIERQKGIKAEAQYSKIQARIKGRQKDKWSFLNWYIPPSAEDFRGLTAYAFAGKGKQGEKDQKFIEDNIMTPYARGVAALETARQTMKEDYSRLTNLMGKPFRRKLGKKIPGTNFTYENAVRVTLFTRSGYDMTKYGLSKRDVALLNKTVENDSELSGFADGVQSITKRTKYIEPTEFWDSGNIMQDYRDFADKVLRKEYLSEFNENVDLIFDEKTLNKIEALYGTKHREALEDSIYRMKTGRNRTFGQNRIVNGWMNWVNDAIGTIMFFNRRSALLQTISSFNFINWSDNNPLKSAIAFANQKQYWTDFAFIWNSAKLKQRRGGLKGDVQEAELAEAAKRGGVRGVISYLLKIGFTPTQLADNFAISSGGATFYRNRINTYLKQGMSQAEAEAQAWADFSKISDMNQQSADPSLISQEQASVLGRLILAFQNTPMQYSRLIKKAGQDLINGRGDAKTNISKIVYYGMIQNFIFASLQNALFALVPGFGDEEETEEKELARQAKKQETIINSMIDTLLRGSGLKGAVLSTVKNTIREYYEQEQKGFLADHAYTIIEAINISPPIGSKARKIYGAIQTSRIDADIIAKRGWEVTMDGRLNISPSYNVVGQLASALFNLPLDRALIEVNGVAEALDQRNTAWQRIALALGWRTWGVGAKNEEHDLIKVEAKERRKKEGIEKAKKTRKENKRKEEQRIANMTFEERLEYDAEQDRKNKEKARKAKATREENQRIKDSIATAFLFD